MHIKVAWICFLCFRSGGLTNVPQTPTTMRGFKIKFALTRCIPCQCHATFILDISSESSHPGSHLKSLEKILLKRVPEIFTLFLKSNVCPKFKLKFWKFHIFPYFLPDKNIIGKVRENSNYLNPVVSIRISNEQFGQKFDFWNSVI